MTVATRSGSAALAREERLARLAAPKPGARWWQRVFGMIHGGMDMADAIWGVMGEDLVAAANMEMLVRTLLEHVAKSFPKLGAAGPEVIAAARIAQVLIMAAPDLGSALLEANPDMVQTIIKRHSEVLNTREAERGRTKEQARTR